MSKHIDLIAKLKKATIYNDSDNRSYDIVSWDATEEKIHIVDHDGEDYVISFDEINMADAKFYALIEV